MGKMTFRVCVPCQRGDCDCKQYDGLDIDEMPKGWEWMAHDDSIHGHDCHCYYDVEGSLESERRKIGKALHELKICFAVEVWDIAFTIERTILKTILKLFKRR